LQEFTNQLGNTFGATIDEGYFDGWVVNIVSIDNSEARRHRRNTYSYYLEGIANVYENGQLWSTAPNGRASFAKELQATLQSHGFPSATVDDYPWPLIAGDTLFTFGYLRPNQIDPESTEQVVHGEGDEGGSGMGVGILGILIGVIVGVLASAGLAGVFFWQRRQQTTIGQTNGEQRLPNQRASNPNIFVDHVASHQVADMDVSLLEGNHPQPTMANYFDDQSTQGESALMGVNLSSDLLADGDLTLWDPSIDGIPYVADFFETESVGEGGRSTSDLSGSSAPSA